MLTLACDGARARLDLLSGFQLRCGGRAVRLPLGGQRLLAFLALNPRDQLRSYVAGTLWPDCPEEHAGANLRSGLWRLRSQGLHLTDSAGPLLRLAPTVDVDVHEMERAAAALCQPGAGQPLPPELLVNAGELLPGFDEDWVLVERERLRQLRLHALEALCRRLTSSGLHGQAVAAGLAAVSADPFRESAQTALIEAYVAEGNRAEALRQYRRYRGVLSSELGLEPSVELRSQFELLPAS